MNVVHYLDAARLGLMSPTARRRHEELARFAAVAAASPAMDVLLHEGGDAWPESARTEFPSLGRFPGIRGFRENLLGTLGCGDEQRLILGTSSTTLIRISARLLFGPCRRVLTTDLIWPVYQKSLARASAARSRSLFVVPLREFIKNTCPSEAEIVRFVSDQFQRHGCDGLFLTAVSHDGIRFPVGLTVAAIRERSDLKTTIVDGAQEFAQVEHLNSLSASDLYMTSGHKWAGGFIPIAIGVFGGVGYAERIEKIVSDQLATGVIDDPLARLCWDTCNSEPIDAPSTANVAALFACDAALADLKLETGKGSLKPITDQDTEQLVEFLRQYGWRPMAVSSSCRSRTLVLNNERLGNLPSTCLRSQFAEQGLAVTAYDGGAVRFSIPRTDWDSAAQYDVGIRAGAATSSLA